MSMSKSLYMMIKEQSDDFTKTAALFPQDKLNILALTWNLYGSVPSSEAVHALFQTNHLAEKADLICFGTQECQRSLLASFCLQSKDEWEHRLTHSLPNHSLVATEVMRGLHIAILVKKSLQNYFEEERKLRLRAGTCNIMGNKGAIAIEFSVLGQSFQVINCHLAPHQNQNDRRNQIVNSIIDQIVKKDPICEVIWLGDLNYRIEMTKQHYKQITKDKQNTDAVQGYSQMIHQDQLRLQKALQTRFLKIFEEGNIEFPPTYKIGLTSGQYNRQRIPGWTDRIFHRKSGKMSRQSYNCAYKVYGCDHRPVFASYSMSLDQNPNTFTSENMVRVKTKESCQLI